jgi:hypothetical protein
MPTLHSRADFYIKGWSNRLATLHQRCIDRSPVLFNQSCCIRNEVAYTKHIARRRCWCFDLCHNQDCMEDDSIVVAILGYIGCGCRDYQCRFSLHNILGRLLYRPAVSTSVAYVGGVTASLPSKAHFGRFHYHHHSQFPTRASRHLNCLDFASLSHSNSAAD